MGVILSNSEQVLAFLQLKIVDLCSLKTERCCHALFTHSDVKENMVT